MIKINNYYQEKMKEFKIEYNEFVNTADGKKWKEHWENETGSKSRGNFGDYLYDFYPEWLA